MTLDANELSQLVHAWLPTQRWFMGKDRNWTLDGVHPYAELPEVDDQPRITIWLADVSYADGEQERYQLPLVSRHEPVVTLDHALVGTLDGEGGPHWVYDALHDPDVTQAYLVGLQQSGDHGPLHFKRLCPPEDLPLGQPSVTSTAEQSNTSLIFGDVAILKVFRRLQLGVNPDIEVHEVLTELGCKHIASLFGSLSGDLDGDTVGLALMQRYLTTATEGWQLAKTSIRDLLAEADLHPDEVGGDFAGEAHRLGVAIGELHRDLRRAFLVGSQDSATLLERAARMHRRLDDALKTVPALAEFESALRIAFDEFAAAPTPVSIQRIHGDLHLGQVMRTTEGWSVLDFEGQPLTEISKRRAMDSPLRDVAGMLRSLDYAAWHQIIDISHQRQAEYRAGEWSDRNRDALCSGYAEASGRDPRDDLAVLRGFEADKAVYEAVYEARNRPHWLAIPLNSLSRLTKQGP